ncbi:hypothetical protein [Corynebacterium guangdongense]|uniref:Nitrate/nitrite transporter NarK n=1 Tax=Corynebacterium guangdongense TaxID=1783348 RepID=A0ABU1ZUM1_9CORY|nr:hypothetical protein [Corynebacterium guangdongense]MDR7328631.1 nitrate/nitrite transporter NarK [Corynebacterium guangdongense]WJZ17208.1 hypothetical protein CGUA_03060 [Corynebacterium guangdongense]
MRALIYLILGAILLAVGIWWILSAGFSVMAIVAMLLTATGGAVFVAGIAVALDMFAPTSKKI